MILHAMISSDFVLPILIGIVAFLYAGVGHGGASGYIAVMVLLGCAPAAIRQQALLLNCMVSLLSFIAFYRIAGVDRKVVLPLCLCSVPAAFLGGMMELSDQSFHLVLGLSLLFPVFRLLEIPRKNTTSEEIKEPAMVSLVLAGLGIGLISGMIGIGGGVLLSPLFLMMGWSGPKPVAALSALFIFVNSVSGLAAQSLVHGQDLFSGGILQLILSALAGGLLGARFGAGYLNSIQLKRLLATVILIASVKLIIA